MNSLVQATVFLLLLAVTCQGCGSHPPSAPPEEEKPEQKEKHKVNYNDPKYFGGWSPPPGADMNRWLEHWKAGQGWASDPNKDNLGSAAIGWKEQWPPGWENLGPGIDGVPPPPWAWIPKKDPAKPSYCYLPPEYGACEESEERWGYNPYKDDCETFQYSGCRGNQNNFKSKERCVSACLDTSVAGCDPDSHIYIEDFITAD